MKHDWEEWDKVCGVTSSYIWWKCKRCGFIGGASGDIDPNSFPEYHKNMPRCEFIVMRKALL